MIKYVHSKIRQGSGGRVIMKMKTAAGYLAEGKANRKEKYVCFKDLV